MAKKNVRSMKVCGQSGYKYETVPAITLKGKWLEEMGFHLGDYVRVKCENGQLIITPDVNKTQEKAAKTAFMEEEIRKLEIRYKREKDEIEAKYVEETVIHDAFVTMINKLVFGHQKILKPLLGSLKSTDDKDKLNKIKRIDQEIENIAMQKQTLVGLAAQGILKPAIYNEECSVLAIEEERLLAEKKSLISDIGGDRTKLKELEKLMQFTAKGHMFPNTTERNLTFLLSTQAMWRR